MVKYKYFCTTFKQTLSHNPGAANSKLNLNSYFNQYLMNCTNLAWNCGICSVGFATRHKKAYHQAKFHATVEEFTLGAFKITRNIDDGLFYCPFNEKCRKIDNFPTQYV